MKELEVSVFVSGYWNIPRHGHGGLDGQFVSIAEASQFALDNQFDSADIRDDLRNGSLINRNGIQGWHFPATNQFIPLEG